ncbi:hypothetical protein [Aquamicrobium terrae]
MIDPDATLCTKFSISTDPPGCIGKSYGFSAIARPTRVSQNTGTIAIPRSIRLFVAWGLQSSPAPGMSSR